MTLLSDRSSLGLARHFTTQGVHPYDEVDWERRDARIENWLDGGVAFEQTDVEFPVSWSATAGNIVAQKYFRGQLGSDGRERSLRQVIDRVVGAITEWGRADGYFSGDEADVFAAELTWLLLHQRMAFNSPVWFNIGVAGAPQQASACFILHVEDTIDSILNWYVEEGKIFQGGSGAGVNLSALRGSMEPLSRGGTASGPVSFMRGADASAGTIKSGGTTRRAAKMVVLDADHPDVEDFIWCKAREERKIRVLRDAGFEMDLDGLDGFSVQYQNANNSVRLSDDFMRAVDADGDWALTGRTDGATVRTARARELFGAIAAAAWECADPGVQFATTINHWHTTPNAGPITASNPCSEYVHLDNSSCNLASLNLLAFLDEAGTFDIDGFRRAVEITFVAQDILVGNADYPTPAIAATTLGYRQLGLGYANLGAALMALGLPYDSAQGRSFAAAVTALMTGQAYVTSARMAARLGPYDGYAADADNHRRVLDQHRASLPDPADGCPDAALAGAAREVWAQAVRLASVDGVRNAQATVLAPTGTISFMMDCDTTGIEPDLGLVKHKKLVGGGSILIVNQTVARALRGLGYEPTDVEAIAAYVVDHGTIRGAPGLDPAHLPVFACSMGDNVIGPEGHVRMMASVQPFLSGAISKTVNLPESATAGDIEGLVHLAWSEGVKSIAVYRDGSKVGQPLSTSTSARSDGSTDLAAMAGARAEEAVGHLPRAPVREQLPRQRRSRTFSFRVADCHGFMTVGEYDDGRPGEIFLTVAKQGSTLSGIMDAFAIAVSHGLQYGVPLRGYVEAFTNVRFEPAGITDDPELRIAASLVDYIFRRLALEYMPYAERLELGVLATHERGEPALPGLEEAGVESTTGAEVVPDPPSTRPAGPAPAGGAAARSPGAAVRSADAPLCYSCGSQMVRAGSCHACPSCGSTSGCS